MKKNILYLGVALLLVSCFKANNDSDTGKGFLSDAIRLAGQDTMIINRGSKGNTNTAFLDGSSLPVNFQVVEVRDEAGNRIEEFFTDYEYRTWLKPYDFLTDNTEEAVLAKLETTMKRPLIVNAVNGQVQYLETTSNVPGDEGTVYHLDVQVDNLAGSRYLKDYAILKMGPKGQPFRFEDISVGLSLYKPDGTGRGYPWWDQMSSGYEDFELRRANIYANNGQEERVQIEKVSDEPAVGVVVTFAAKCMQNGAYFPSDGFVSAYAPGSGNEYENIMQYSTNRVDKADGMELSFPMTPWPVDEGARRSYIVNGPMDTEGVFDFDEMISDHDNNIGPNNGEQSYSSLWWPRVDSEDPESAPDVQQIYDSPRFRLYLRTALCFYESGTWKVTINIPYVSL